MRISTVFCLTLLIICVINSNLALAKVIKAANQLTNIQDKADNATDRADKEEMSYTMNSQISPSLSNESVAGRTLGFGWRRKMVKMLIPIAFVMGKLSSVVLLMFLINIANFKMLKLLLLMNFGYFFSKIILGFKLFKGIEKVKEPLTQILPLILQKNGDHYGSGSDYQTEFSHDLSPYRFNAPVQRPKYDNINDNINNIPNNYKPHTTYHNAASDQQMQQYLAAQKQQQFGYQNPQGFQQTSNPSITRETLESLSQQINQVLKGPKQSYQ